MSRLPTQWSPVLWAGVRKGWASFVWICQIVVPISFVIALIQWSGLLHQANFLLNPLMRLINLPGEAALPIISGILVNLYAALAMLAVLPFSVEQMTLIAIFSLIAHNLIAEGIIQMRSGIGIVRITLIRLAAAALTVIVVSQFLGDTTKPLSIPYDPTFAPPFLEALKAWAIDALGLLLKILIIIMGIMVALESLRALGWLEYLLRALQPVMRILGLSNRTGMLWLTAVIFGLMYGGAVIIEEARKGTLTKEELEHLHISIGINHSMVEDPALFLMLGLNGFWLWVPKFLMAALAVHTYRAARYAKKGWGRR